MKYKKTETYIPSKPCKRGHYERYIISRACVECMIFRQQKNEERIKARRKLYYEENKENILKQMKVSSKKWYEENKEEILRKDKASRHLNPEKTILISAKGRAKKNGLEFNMTISDIVIPKHCPIFTEIELIKNHNKVSYNSPSLDRVDNTKGYITGNVKIISNKANMLKNNGTLEDFKRLIEYIESSSQEKN